MNGAFKALRVSILRQVLLKKGLPLHRAAESVASLSPRSLQHIHSLALLPVACDHYSFQIVEEHRGHLRNYRVASARSSQERVQETFEDSRQASADNAAKEHTSMHENENGKSSELKRELLQAALGHVVRLAGSVLNSRLDWMCR
jgi:hypothetical protein